MRARSSNSEAERSHKRTASQMRPLTSEASPPCLLPPWSRRILCIGRFRGILSSAVGLVLRLLRAISRVFPTMMVSIMIATNPIVRQIATNLIVLHLHVDIRVRGYWLGLCRVRVHCGERRTSRRSRRLPLVTSSRSVWVTRLTVLRR
jgi:hypothetical protein